MTQSSGCKFLRHPILGVFFVLIKGFLTRVLCAFDLKMANTISGNARTEFGSEFIISPPHIVESAPNVSYLPKDRQSYITPFTWRGHKAVIGICIT